jgi:hypothetical protein
MPVAVRFLSRRIDARYLAVTRIILGLCLLIKSLSVLHVLGLLLRPQVLRLPYFLQVPDLPVAWTDSFFMAWMLVAVMMVMGAFTKFANLGAVGLIVYYLALDQQTYSNHTYALAIWLTILLFADSGAMFSFDTRLRGAKLLVPAWPADLLKLQVSLCYAFSVITKLNASYLNGDVLSAYLRNDLPAALFTPWALVALSLVSIAIEAGLAIGLWIPRFRKVVALGGLAFHLILTLAVGPMDLRQYLELTVFTGTMLSTYVLFFAPVHVDAAAMKATAGKM